MNTIKSYIVVDDDPWNNKICQFNIKKALGNVDVKVFSLPEEGLAFIEKEFIKNLQPTVLFLDINMPVINGWAFLEQYESFSDEIKKNIFVYMLTSSISAQDELKAKSNKHIKDFISKPLVADKIESVANSTTKPFFA